LEYRHFTGDVIFPKIKDFFTAYKLQEKLLKLGKPKSFADLLIAAIRVNRQEKLVTKDEDFLDIAEISTLNVEIIK